MTQLRFRSFTGSTAPRRPGWTGDLALAGLVLLLAAFFPLLIGFRSLGSAVLLQFAVAVLMITPLALRSHYPQLMLALITLGGIGHLFVATGPLPCLVVVPWSCTPWRGRWTPGAPGARWWWVSRPR